MRFLGLMLLGTLGLGGCAKSPVLDANDLPRVASEYVAIFNDLDSWDEARVTALFAKPSKAKAQREHMGWMHAQVGDCGEMQPIWQVGTSRARYGFHCERGDLEVHLRLDKQGNIAGVISGVAGVEPTAPVAEAFKTVLAAMPWREAVAGQHAWGDGIMPRWARKRGQCELDRVRVVSQYVGMFDLRCEHGNMYMKVAVKKNGAIGAVQVWRPEEDEAVAFRNKPTG